MTRTATVVAASVLGVSLFVGCRATNVARNYAVDPSNETGIAVVSLTMSGLPSRYNMFVSLRGVNVDHHSSVPVTDLFASSDWRCPLLTTATDEEPCGRLVVIELPKGEYEFYAWQGGGGGGGEPRGFTTRVASSEKFSMRFTVLAGKTVYLGNIHFAIRRPPGFRGKGTYTMEVSDLQDRDLRLLFSKYPNLSRDRVVVSILEDQRP